MEAGKLFQEIVIEQRGETINSIGESVAAWSTYASCYAEVSRILQAVRHSNR
jgi:head-tail adaptor